MTINQLLNDETISQKIKDASISPVSITMWINDLESQIAQLFNKPFTKLYYPEDKDKTLLLPTIHIDIYILYLSAMIDFFSGDMDKYNDSAMKFRDTYNCMKWNLEFDLKID